MSFFLSILVCILIIALIQQWRAHHADEAYLKESHQKSLNKIKERSRAQEQELELLLNAFDDALVVINKKGIIRVANRATNKLCRGRNLRGKSFVSAFLNEPVSNTILAALNTGEPFREKITLPGNSFGDIPETDISAWIIDVAPLQMGDDQLYRVILRDVSAEHKTDQIKREFVANASHELRTPLAIINGYIENLLEDDIVENPSMAKKFLLTMQKHGTRLSALVEDMLSISKIESGDSTTLNIDEFLISELFEDIKDRLIPMTHETESTISTEVKEKELYIRGDRFYWDQILFNLTENALKQNKDRKINVKLKAKKRGDRIIVTVTDTGKGIPVMHLPYIFNRFYRVQKHHSQNEIKGTGLGLAIVKRAVEAHQGCISVESNPGENTTFKVDVPLSPTLLRE